MRQNKVQEPKRKRNETETEDESSKFDSMERDRETGDRPDRRQDPNSTLLGHLWQRRHKRRRINGILNEINEQPLPSQNSASLGQVKNSEPVCEIKEQPLMVFKKMRQTKISFRIGGKIEAQKNMHDIRPIQHQT